ncbi:helix-turn-helix transcriptional regulator [Archangium violaceum]|uniref:winged helix-turn-helix transcriptional regulator n=1 Tax=Archangium violaceum TaxID=83451 RepID=UPI002B30D954|nr:helix-turn-helix transcriptional regulator [Archangium violaceum]
MRKTSSTNFKNERALDESCPLAYAIRLIGHRWKPHILWDLFSGPKRFSEMKARTEGISERMLASQLKQLEADGLIEKLPISPGARVAKYRISQEGQQLQPLLLELARWGQKHRATQQDSVRRQREPARN